MLLTPSSSALVRQAQRAQERDESRAALSALEGQLAEKDAFAERVDRLLEERVASEQARKVEVETRRKTRVVDD